MYQYMIYEVPELKDLISWVDPEVFLSKWLKEWDIVVEW